MVNIRQTPKVEDGNSGFLGDVGKLMSIASPAVSLLPGIGPAVGAGMAVAGGLSGLSAKQGAAEQPTQIGGNGDAMRRRIQELMQPSQLQPPQMMGNPMQRRMGY